MKKQMMGGLLALIVCGTINSQSFTDNFDAGSPGPSWQGNANYVLSQTSGMLVVSVNKNTPEQFFTLDWPGTLDVSANSLLNVKVKGSKAFILRATLYASDGSSLAKEIRVGSGSQTFVNCCFDFSSFAGKNIADKIQFAVNPPENSFSGTICFEDLIFGTGAVKLCGIGPINDVVVYKGTTHRKILVSDLVNASGISLTGTGSIIGNIQTSSIQNGFASITFDCLATGTTTATLTANASTGYVNNDVNFNITVEDDIAPTVNKPSDVSVPVGKESTVKVEGISDGNASVEQIIKVTATSSNPTSIPNPEVVYDTMGSPYATLKIKPTAAGTATITITVKDNGTINNTTTTTFNVTAYEGYNYAPTIQPVVKQTIVYKSPYKKSILLAGIGDGDNGAQTLTITATGTTGVISPVSPVPYVQGKDTATLWVTANSTGKDTIQVTVTDNGNNGSNNGNQSATILIPVEVIMPAPTGYKVVMNDFSADTAAKLWHIEQLGVSQFVSYVDTLGKRCMRIIMKQKWDYAGIWLDLYRIPLELDLSNAPYISYEILSPDINPLVTRVYFWDADSVRNLDGGRLETDTLVNPTTFKKVFIDFRKPGYLNSSAGVPIDASRISMILFNNHKNAFAWPNTLIDGVVYITDIRIGDSCQNVPPVTPVCTINNMPDQVLFAGTGTYSITLSGISNGNGSTSGVTITALSSKTPFIPTPEVGTLNTDGTAKLTFSIANQNIDSSTLIIRVNCTGSIQKEIRFKVKTVSPSYTAANVITVDAATPEQTIQGFGAMQVPEEVLEQYVKDQGCTLMRLTFDEDFEINNDNHDPYVLDRSKVNKQALNLDYIRKASQAGVTDFFITLWSPPGWMKQNCSAVGGDYSSYNWETNKNKVDTMYYDEYVEYMVSIVRIIKEETGVEIAGFCPQNEPGFVEPYGSAVLDPVHMAQVCGMLGKRLSEEGFKTKVINSEQVFTQGNWPVTQYANAVKNDPLAKIYNKVIAMHYPTDNESMWAAQWTACKNAGQEFWATECTSEGNNYGGVIYQCKAMIIGLNNGVSAWAVWGYNQGASGDEFDVTKKSGMTFMKGKSIHYHAYKNFAKFIRKGAVQLKTTSGNAAIKAATFKNTDSTLVIVLLNTDSKMPMAVRIAGGAPATGYEAYRTTYYERCEKVYPFNGKVIALPPLSLTTLVVKTNINHAPSADQPSDVVLEKNTGTVVSLTGIGCGDPVPQNITITATSSDTNIVGHPAVTYTSPSTKATLLLKPKDNATGQVTVTIILKDDGGRDNGGIDADTITFKVTVGSLSSNKDEQRITVYPNPASDVLTIGLSGTDKGELLLCNMAGQPLMKEEIYKGQTSIKLNVNHLPAGMYLIRIKYGAQDTTEKIRIE